MVALNPRTALYVKETRLARMNRATFFITLPGMTTELCAHL